MKKIIIAFFIIAILGVAGFFGVRWLLSLDKGATTETIADVYLPPPDPEIPDFIDLQPIVDEWLNEYAHGEVAIEIYDLNNSTVAASYRSAASMYPLSLYKLFYTYDGYAQIDAGTDDPNALYLGNYTLGECLDLMIRESHNPCAETMLGETAREARVGQLVQKLGLTNTQPDGLKTSAHDVSLLLQHYYVHPEWSEDSWLKYRDSALNQPPTAAGDFRQGLPSGIRIATVFDKVGWQGGAGGGTGWNFYNDAAIVEFPEIDKTGDIVQVIDSSNTESTTSPESNYTEDTSQDNPTNANGTTAASTEVNSERLAVSASYDQVDISYTNVTDADGEKIAFSIISDDDSSETNTSTNTTAIVNENETETDTPDANIVSNESIRTKIVTLDETQYEYTPEVQPRRYIMVIMTRNTSHLVIRALGEMLEEAILSYQFNKVHNITNGSTPTDTTLE